MLSNQGTLIVTGSSRGIGAAIAQRASARGYSVAVNFATGEAEARAGVLVRSKQMLPVRKMSSDFSKLPNANWARSRL
jgi:NAD(P)-dependent dehydrogenase (short-subunit alcohol dehydrogenase family)